MRIKRCACVVVVLWAMLVVWPDGFAGHVAWADGERQWTWMKGASTFGQSGTYGTLGTPAAANTPGARCDTASWTDSSGALWVFGGWGQDSAGTTGFLNDLWKFNPITKNWTWMKGSKTYHQSGTYGTLGVSAAANNPGGRGEAVLWTNSPDTLWLFGGNGIDGIGKGGKLNDLWKYDTGTGLWTWMKGANTADQSGTYGTLGTPAAANIPGARTEAVCWTDTSGALWLFGGEGFDGVGNTGYLNDLWKYDPGTGYWTWMNGGSTINHSGFYGMIGTPMIFNIPGARSMAVSWTDTSGALWLLGGYGHDVAGNVGYLNDLWKYDPGTGYWTWMNGSDMVGLSGTYGSLGVSAMANTPGARREAVAGTDTSGALWLLGGYGHDVAGNVGHLNDLWKYDTGTGYWTWMKGANTADQSGTYGTLGMPAAANIPGPRQASIMWADSSGTLWLFGGYGQGSDGRWGFLNDLWSWKDVTAPTGSIVINNNYPDTKIVNVRLDLTWSDGAGDGVSLMKFSNDGTTWTDWEPVAATKLWSLPEGEGYKTVRVQYRDKAGNNSLVYSDFIRVDTTPPTGSIVINNNLSVTNNHIVTLGLTWSDEGGSGVTHMKFSNDSKTWTAWEPVSPTKSWTLLEGQGYRTVRVQFRDSAGNYSVLTNDYIRVDAIPPTGTILINNGAVSTKNRNVSLRMTWADDVDGSGVVRMRFSIDGRTWTAWETLKGTKGYTLPAETGKHYTVRVTYRDAGGNISAAYNDYIRLDAP